jgi:hypothetical protein
MRGQQKNKLNARVCLITAVPVVDNQRDAGGQLYSRRFWLFTTPSSSGWPHGHRGDWEDQMVM